MSQLFVSKEFLRMHYKRRHPTYELENRSQLAPAHFDKSNILPHADESHILWDKTNLENTAGFGEEEKNPNDKHNDSIVDLKKFFLEINETSGKKLEDTIGKKVEVELENIFKNESFVEKKNESLSKFEIQQIIQDENQQLKFQLQQLTNLVNTVSLSASFFLVLF